MRVSRNAQRAGAIVLVLVAAALAYTWSRTPHPSSVVAPETRPPVAERVLVQRGPRSDPRPDILLFTIDTTRADHVSAYGYERPTSPTIDAVAARGTRFDRAYAAATWTVPSVASIVSGVIPSRHGVQHGLRVGAQVVDQEILSPELPTIAASLHDAGYRTVGVTANVHLGELLGFARGFDSYACLNFATVSYVRAAVAEHLAELRDGNTPYFLWVHLVDPHAPYLPTGPIFDTFRAPDLAHYPALDADELAETLDSAMLREHIPLREGWNYEIAAYDSEIRAADDYLAELLGELDDGHLVVMISSDHGEEFHDHMQLGHGHTAFDEVARVPLVLATPGQTHRVENTTVSLVDVLPTLLDVAGVPAPASAMGRSLLPATRGERLDARDAIIETGRLHEVVRAIVRGSIKYGRRVEPDPIEGLFDLDADPDEIHSILRAQPELAATLRADLDRVVEAAAAQRPQTTTAPIEISEDVRASLRALGYGN
jgi:arylsulfatase A-like enzyme